MIAILMTVVEVRPYFEKSNTSCLFLVWLWVSWAFFLFSSLFLFDLLKMIPWPFSPFQTFNKPGDRSQDPEADGGGDRGHALTPPQDRLFWDVLTSTTLCHSVYGTRLLPQSQTFGAASWLIVHLVVMATLFYSHCPSGSTQMQCCWVFFVFFFKSLKWIKKKKKLNIVSAVDNKIWSYSLQSY